MATVVALLLLAGCRESRPSLSSRGAIDTVLVRTVDLRSDGRPDTVALHIVADGCAAPFTWTLTITSDARRIYSVHQDDSRLDRFFGDEGYVAGCRGYLECKRKYYFNDLLADSLDPPFDLEGVLDTAQSNTLRAVAGSYLAEHLGPAEERVGRIVSSMERLLRSNRAFVICVSTSPVTHDPLMMYVPELDEFVPIYID